MKISVKIIVLSGLTLSFAHKRPDNKSYNNIEHKKNLEMYEKSVNKIETLELLADSYYLSSDYAEASKWYGILFELQPETEKSEYYHRYSNCLKTVGKYDEANQYLEKFYKSIGKETPEIKTYLKEIEANSWNYEVENAGEINSEESDYGTTFYKDKLVFTSTRKTGKRMARKNQLFAVLFSAEKNEDGNYQEADIFLDDLMSQVNQSTPVFTKDGNTVYFTRNNFLKQIRYSNKKRSLLKIYRAELKNGKWTNVTELPFNNDNYSVAHPSLSSDEKTLYFASDMPGTLGDSDIWKVKINKDGSFSEPENLGPKINTEGKESFPFVSEDDELYYASNGKLGLGGLDIFKSKKDQKGNYQEAVNMGKPINSPMDDFAFYLDVENNTGFLSSNREGGKGSDDIYKFNNLSDFISGLVTDADTEEALIQARVKLFDKKGELLSTTFTNDQGQYHFDKNLIEKETNYRIRVENSFYSTTENFLKADKTKLNVALKPTTFQLEAGKDLGITNIFFDLNKSDIRTDAAIELAKVLQVLLDYPQMKIEIRSHTDSRDEDLYNKKLSEQRAKSTRKWLIQNGIKSDRITAKGYGETQLLNGCSNGVKCTEEEHQVNRRSELFIITGMEE